MARKKINIKAPKILSIVMAVLYIALGVVIIIYPKISLVALCLILGVATVLLGLLKIIGYFSKDLYCLAFQFDLAIGIASLIFGILLILHPGFVVSILPFLIGFFIMFSGLFTIQTARDSRAFGLKYWWVLLTAAILSVVLGILLVFNPFKSAVAIMFIVGVSLVISGGERLAVSIITIKRSSERGKRDENGFIDVDFTEE